MYECAVGDPDKATAAARAQAPALAPGPLVSPLQQHYKGGHLLGYQVAGAALAATGQSPCLRSQHTGPGFGWLQPAEPPLPPAPVPRGAPTPPPLVIPGLSPPPAPAALSPPAPGEAVTMQTVASLLSKASEVLQVSCNQPLKRGRGSAWPFMCLHHTTFQFLAASVTSERVSDIHRQTLNGETIAYLSRLHRSASFRRTRLTLATGHNRAMMSFRCCWL